MTNPRRRPTESALAFVAAPHGHIRRASADPATSLTVSGMCPLACCAASGLACALKAWRAAAEKGAKRRYDLPAIRLAPSAAAALLWRCWLAHKQHRPSPTNSVFAFGGAHGIGPAAAGEEEAAAAAGVETTPGARSFAIRAAHFEHVAQMESIHRALNAGGVI